LRKIGVSLPTDLVRRLRMAAIATDRTMSAIITDLVADWLAAQDAKAKR
jgi:predicted transcriptional regulator